jgi:hypothetical protein
MSEVPYEKKSTVIPEIFDYPESVVSCPKQFVSGSGLRETRGAGDWQ